MLNVLYLLEKQLPNLLSNNSIWKSLYIDYDTPVVERIWCQWKSYRVYLHRIYPCKTEDALLHPHPWPQAVHVLQGKYEMGIGFGSGTTTPPIAARVIVEKGFYYELTNKDSWHYVRPINEPSFSVMVTGLPWGRPSPKSTKPLRPLQKDIYEDLLGFFKEKYK